VSSADARHPTTSGDRTGLIAANDLHAAARTDRGTVRPDNQDAFVCVPERGLFAVIDGMGGQQGGQLAAAVARESLLKEKDLVRALVQANQKIHQQAQRSDELRGMGCVASGVRVAKGKVHIAHVGDTRIYLAGSTGCEQLTRDHTVAASRQEDLGISHRGARDMAGHNQVTRDIGGRPQADDHWIDRAEVPLEEGALMLMCSDGLYGVVPAEELFSRLREARRSGTSPNVLVDELVDLALARGTRDNVTAVVVRRSGPPAAEARGASKAAPGAEVGPAAAPAPAAAEVRATPTPVPAAKSRRRVGGLWLLLLGAALGWAARPWVLTPPPVPPPAIPPAPVEMTTDVPGGSDRQIRGTSISAPTAGRWSIRIGPRSRLALREMAVDAPGLVVAVSLAGPDSRLEIVDTRLALASLAVEGPPGSRVAVRGGELVLRDGAPRVLGATLDRHDLASTPERNEPASPSPAPEEP
jgi:PPM family protein phosphatase